MCPTEKLPNIDRIPRLLTAIHNDQVEIPEHVDVYEAENQDLPLDGDFIGAVTRQLDFISAAPPEERLARLIQGGDRVLAEYDNDDTYTSIFSTLARRANRTSTRPQTRSREWWLLLDWYAKIALHDPAEGKQSEYVSHPFGDPDQVAIIFEMVVRDNLPRKLDLTSWPAQVIIPTLESRIQGRGPRYEHGRLEVWQPWMRTPEARVEVLRRRSAPPGLSTATNFVPFLGEGGKGRLVWRSNQSGVPKPVSAQEYQDDKEVRKSIAKLEKDLAVLGAAVANHLVHWLVDYVVRALVHKQRMRGLRFDRLIAAVKEILGEEWFDLPFDTEGLVRSWEDGPVTDLSRRELLQVVRIRGSGYRIPE